MFSIILSVKSSCLLTTKLTFELIFKVILKASDKSMMSNVSVHSRLRRLIELRARTNSDVCLQKLLVYL